MKGWDRNPILAPVLRHDLFYSNIISPLEQAQRRCHNLQVNGNMVDERGGGFSVYSPLKVTNSTVPVMS